MPGMLMVLLIETMSVVLFYSEKAMKKIVFICLFCFYNSIDASDILPIYIPPDVVQYVGRDNFDEYFLPVFTDDRYDVCKVSINGYSLLRSAVVHFPAMVLYLIQRGADVHENDGKSLSVLSIACKQNSFIAVKSLLEHGADPNCPSNRGSTALSWACECGSIELINSLLKYGAVVNVTNSRGSTP